MRLHDLGVGLHHTADVAFGPHVAALEQHAARAQPRDRGQVMRDEADRLLARPELIQLGETLALEVLVAHREDLVDEQHVRIDVGRDGEREPHVHARRIRLHAGIEEVPELGEVHDRREDAVGLLA